MLIHGLADDNGKDLYNLDNIDKPLLDGEIIEDTSSFEDRLKRLQSDREKLKPVESVEQKKIDFTNNDFPKDEFNEKFILK